jgi:hypothetical protein
LAKAFGCEDVWGLQVVGATPITLLVNLTIIQAKNIQAALGDVERAGSRLEIRAAEDPTLPKVSWNGPVRIRGRLLEEYGWPGAVPPALGSMANASVVCPHCRKALRVSLSPANSMQEVVVGNGLQDAQPSVALPKPRLSGIPVPVPTRGTLKPPMQFPTPPLPISPIAAGLGDLEEIPEPSVSANHSGVSSGTMRKPLPDVPVISDVGELLEQKTPKVGDVSADLEQFDELTEPMDLSAFEAGLNLDTTSLSIAQTNELLQDQEGVEMENYLTPSVALQPTAAMVAPTAEEVAGDDSDAICSVFISRNRKPEVHELLAEITGISVDDAAERCDKPVVPVMKEISLTQGREICRLFLEVGVKARLVIKA